MCKKRPEIFFLGLELSFNTLQCHKTSFRGRWKESKLNVKYKREEVIRQHET